MKKEQHKQPTTNTNATTDQAFDIDTSWGAVLNNEAAIAQTTRDTINATLIVSLALNVMALTYALMLMS
jgi:hypothetical protein